MAVEVKKQERETTQGLIRRFTKRIQKSGILIEARKKRFHSRVKSKDMKKRSALRKEESRIERGKLEKMGLLKEKSRRGRPSWR
ncbi:MAG: 30S ribosomal protein S21 [Candidatus Pacebacteria bacterium]|nr:30S ribosomal protein S21 [Candidatus Paceibacterota bacterium]